MVLSHPSGATVLGLSCQQLSRKPTIEGFFTQPEFASTIECYDEISGVHLSHPAACLTPRFFWFFEVLTLVLSVSEIYEPFVGEPPTAASKAKCPGRQRIGFVACGTACVELDLFDPSDFIGIRKNKSEFGS